MIDIIIPTYKPGVYIEECLTSLQKQSLSFDKFIVTIVLNGPKYPYYDYLKSILKKNSFAFNLIYSDVANVSVARNKGLDNTKLDFVFFLDDDDILSENYLENILDENKSNSITVSNVLAFYETKSESIQDYLTFSNKFNTNDLVKYRRYLSNSCCKLIPRNIIGSLRFNDKLSRSEDALFMFALSNKIESIISTNRETIYYRRLRPFSLSRGKIDVWVAITQLYKQLYYFSLVYIKGFPSYSFLLFITRVLALLRSFLFKLANNS